MPSPSPRTDPPNAARPPTETPDAAASHHGGEVRPRLVLALGINGVISRHLDEVELEAMPDDYSELPFGAAWVGDARGTARLLHTAPAVVVELDEILQLSGVQLVWVSSDAPWILPRAVELAFGGRLSGGVVVTDRHRASNWKMTQLLGYLSSVGDPPYVWADDTAIEFALRASNAFRTGDIGPRQRLLIRTNPSTGLTLDDIELIREFGRAVLGGKS